MDAREIAMCLCFIPILLSIIGLDIECRIEIKEYRKNINKEKKKKVIVCI